MTVPAVGFSGPTFIQTPGNGVATSYSFPFLITAATDLAVGFIVSGAYAQQISGFTVQAIYPGAGQVVFMTPPSLGTLVDIRSIIPEAQTTNFSNLGGYFPESTTNALDRAVRNIADLYRLTYQFGIHGPDTESTPWPALPAAAVRANTASVFDGNGLPTVGFIPTNLFTQSIFNAMLSSSNLQIFPALATEGSLAVNLSYPVGNALRYGIVPNNPAAASSNQTAIKALCSYKLNNTGWTGIFTFPNTTGADTYYFTNYIDFRPGIAVDGQFCTLQFTKAAPDGTDNNSGFISAIRDFAMRNVVINVNYPSGPAGCSALFLGARGTEGSFYNPFYDSVYLANTGHTLGNIQISNVYLTMNTPGVQIIGMLGGLQDVLFENVWVDGQSVALNGVYGEYGFATDGGGISTLRQSSHANNIKFVNYKATNIGVGSGIAFNGAYNLTIDGLRVITAGSACSFGFGEAYYYNPWSGQDGSGSTKRTITIRNVVAKNLTGTGISIQGANTSSVAGGYLSTVINALPVPQLYQVQTDLVGAIIDGFAINGTSAGLGIQIIGADHIEISNGRLIGFGSGISTTAELNHYSIRNVDILGSSGAGIILGNGFNVWSPPRFSVGNIKGCFIAGSGASNPAISLLQVAACSIENNRFGYSLTHDGITETTQGSAVNVGLTCGGVICQNNFVAATSGGNAAYVLSSSLQSSNGCMVNNPQGVTSMSGAWGVDGVETANGTQLATAAAQINTSNKYPGRLCLNGSNSFLYFSQGSNPTDRWVSADGASTITPT